MTAIVFDLDGTLLEFDGEYRDVLAGAIADIRGDAPEAWLETYGEAFAEISAACKPEPVRSAFARIDDCEDPDAYANALLEREIDSFAPPPNAHVDLERLANSFELGVLTNGVRDWQLAKLRANDLETHFDAVVASSEVSAHKPAVEPYRALEERLPADRYAMVGDSDSDIEGARAAEWTAHRYEGAGFGALPDALEFGLESG